MKRSFNTSLELAIDALTRFGGEVFSGKHYFAISLYNAQKDGLISMVGPNQYQIGVHHALT